MKTFRTIILITGILAAGLAYNTTFAQEPNAVAMEERSPSSKMKHTKDHKYKVKRESKPMAKVHASHARQERKQEDKEVKHETKTYQKARTKKVKVHRSPRPVGRPIRSASTKPARIVRT